MADTGENTFPCEYFRRLRRNVGRHVSVSSLDKALVFCGGNAGDPDLADMHCGIDLENAWVWDVIKAWFATAYTFFK